MNLFKIDLSTYFSNNKTEQKNNKVFAKSTIPTLFFLVSICICQPLQAITVDFEHVSGSGVDYSQKFEEQLNPKLSEISSKKFNLYTANTAVTATRGLSTDYADTNFKYVNIGFTTSLSLAPIDVIEKFKKKQIDVFAFSPALSFSLGLDMHYVPVPILRNFKFFFNVFYFDAAPYAQKAIGSRMDIKKLKTTAVGFHLLYPIVKPQSVASKFLLLWGGINLSGGIDYLANEYEVEFPLKHTLGTQTTTLRPQLELTSKVFTVPLEVSTNVRFLYFLSLFIGFGADFNFGTSKLISKSSTYTASNGDVYRMTANFGKASSPHFMTLRLFGGLQINIWALHIYALVNYSFTSNAVAANVGVRFSI